MRIAFKYILFFLLVPSVIEAQSPGARAGAVARAYKFNYTDIPAAPSGGSSATLTYSAPGNILNSSGGTTQNKFLSGAWTEFHAFSFVGTSTDYQRIINLNGSTVIGSVANHLFTREGTNSTYFGIYGLSAAAPLYFDDVGAVAATSAIQMSAYSAGPNTIVQNIVNDARGYAVFANTSGTLSGGSSSVPTASSNNYQSFPVRFVRSFNATGNKENFYFGATTTNSYAIHHNLQCDNLLGHTSEWDNIQILNAINFSLTKSTFVDGGTDNTGGQNASLQVQNAYGTVEDNIFMGAPQGLRLTTHDLVFSNNYVQWTGNLANEILSYYGNYASTNRLMVTVDTVWIENNDFVATTWTGAVFNVLDPNVIVVMRNNRISGATTLYQDSRGGSPTGSLIDGGGNVFSSTIPTPTFSNFTPTDFTGHGLLTEKYHHMRGRGYRTP